MDMPQASDSFIRTILKKGAPGRWIGIFLSIVVGLSCYMATARSIEKDSEARFLGYANNAAVAIAARIKSYNDVVRSVGGLFQSSDTVGRKQFRDFVTALKMEEHFPAIESISYIEFVAHEDLDRFEKSLQADAYLQTHLDTPITRFFRAAQRRPWYMVGKLIEPRHYYPSVGLAIAADREQGIMQGRDTGRPSSSGMPLQIKPGPKYTRLAIRIAVYRRGAPVSTVAERRLAYLGATGISFSANALVKGVIDEMPVKNARMMLVDRAQQQASGKGLLVDTMSADSSTLTSGARRFTSTLPIDFNGRQWDATFSVDARDMYSSFEEYMPWLTSFAGTFATLLLYALYTSIMSSRMRAIRLAKGMTRELRESKEKLQVSHKNLRALAAHADRIKEDERKRIAREIHDDLGQNLLVLRIDADMLARRTKGNQLRLHERAAETLSHIDTCIKSVRQIINNLRPNALDLGLSAAVEWQVGEFRRRTGLACSLVDDTGDIAFDEQVATAFLRILQESLSNIVRHAHASVVRVELRTTETAFSMTITDNGTGFPLTGKCQPGSFGLIGIQERIGLLGGTCSISNAKPGGAVVAVAVPLDRCHAVREPDAEWHTPALH